MLLAVHYPVMERLGSLESSQEARVARGYRQLLRFFRVLQTSVCSITRWCTLMHEPIFNYDQANKQNLFNFSHAYAIDIGTIFHRHTISHNLTLRSADAILVQIETIKSFETNITYMLDYIH